MPRTPRNGQSEAHSHAQAARDATHSLPWNIASVVPWLGSPFKTGQQITDVVLGLAADVLQPSAHVGAALSPDRLLEGNRLDVQLLRDAGTQAERDIGGRHTTRRRCQGDLRSQNIFRCLRDARTQLQSADLRHCEAAAEYGPGRTSRTVDDGRRWPAHVLHGIPDQCRSPRHRRTARRIRNPSLRQRHGDRGRPLGRTPNSTGSSRPIDLGPEFATQYGFTNPIHRLP